jgi:hypothetical protein
VQGASLRPPVLGVIIFTYLHSGLWSNNEGMTYWGNAGEEQ